MTVTPLSLGPFLDRPVFRGRHAKALSKCLTILTVISEPARQGDHSDLVLRLTKQLPGASQPLFKHVLILQVDAEAVRTVPFNTVRLCSTFHQHLPTECVLCQLEFITASPC